MRYTIVIVSGVLFGALLAVVEGLVVLQRSALGFPTPTADLFAMELRYGLILGAIALLLARLWRRRSTAAVAGATLGSGLAILLGWWVHKVLLDRSTFWQPASLLASGGVLLLAALVAVITAWIARRRGRVGLSLLAAVVVATPWLAASGMNAEAPPARTNLAKKTRPDVTLIIIDTLRADRLSCYGNPRLTSPNLDQLAARGSRFEQCMAQSSWTRPSMASLHSGVYPSSHGCTDLHKVLPQSAWTIAEALQSNGYVTGGFSANAGLSPAYGFAQGFDAFWNTDLQELSRFTMYGRLRHVFMKHVMKVNPDNHYGDAETLTDQVVRWLGGGRDAPVFTYVHYLDPHWPYTPEEYLIDGPQPAAFEDVQRLSAQALYPFDVLPRPPDSAIDSAQHYYDAEIRYCDRSIGRLLDHLKSIGNLDPDDVVIVSSDHGEQFYEHGSWGHGTSMFHEELHVPLIVAGGGVPARTVEQQVRLIDVYPTIL